MAVYGYIRVSTREQNEERQVQALQLWESIHEKIDHVYLDKMSGRTTKRDSFQEMMQTIKAGDTVVVKDISRLSRSLKDLLAIIGEMDKKEVKCIFIKENIDTKTKEGRLMLGMLGAAYEFEVEMSKERQAEGVAIAKEKGKYKGRKPWDIDPNIIAAACRGYIEGYFSLKESVAMLVTPKGKPVSYPTFYRYLDQYCAENNIKRVGFMHMVDPEEDDGK